MEHIAILSKKRKLLGKILSGKKKIESRWYKYKRPPFGCIAEDDVIYFKESGDPVSAKAKVKKLLIYENLNREVIDEIIKKYASDIGVDSAFADKVKDKKFCILIFLKDVEKVKPFKIDKKGYGLMSAWLCADQVDKLRTEFVSMGEHESSHES